jgi:hypothetical protein
MKRGRPKGVRGAAKNTKSEGEKYRVLMFGELADSSETDLYNMLNHELNSVAPPQKSKARSGLVNAVLDAVKTNDFAFFLRLAKLADLRSGETHFDRLALGVTLCAENILALGKKPTGENVAQMMGKIWEPVPIGGYDPRAIRRILRELGY